MKADLTLFVRQDGVEAMWAVVDRSLPIGKIIMQRISPIIRQEVGGLKKQMH